jgi:energy-coupling factor transport system substrate-specific component
MGFLAGSPMESRNWAFWSVVLVSVAIGALFLRYEAGGVTAGEIALTATLATIAGVSRVPFAVIMSVQPTTFIVMISGYVFGAQTGFMVGAVGALVSNFFLGQGPWTPWQMLAWGLMGILAGWLGKGATSLRIRRFTLLAFLGGFLFGWIMNLWHWLGFIYPLNGRTFLATYLASLPFDGLHAVGNLLFTGMFGKNFDLILRRFHRRLGGGG